MSNSKYTLDDSWKIAKDSVEDCTRKLAHATKLEKFVLDHDLGKALSDLHKHRNVREKNFRLLLEACDVLGIPRIYLGWRELVGADDIRHTVKGSKIPRVAIWELCDMLGGYEWPVSANDFSGNCGNTDQYQTRHNHKFFEHKRLGKAYNLKTRRPITIEPFRKRFVCDRNRNAQLPA